MFKSNKILLFSLLIAVMGTTALMSLEYVVGPVNLFIYAFILVFVYSIYVIFKQSKN